MKRLGLGLFLTVLAVVGSASTALADDRVRAELSSYNEVHFVTTTLCASGAAPPCTLPDFVVVTSAALRGAVSSVASGKFRAKIESPNLIEYELSYEGLEGTVTQAHIHFGQPHTVGGIVIWLCATPPPEPGNTPAPPAVAALTPICPQEGTVEGTITSAQLLSQAAQGIDVGPPEVSQAVREAEFAELVRAIRAGATYANVHSSKFGPGEIRGQINGGVLGKLLDFLDRHDH
jgi:hypothetical protein